MSDHAMHACNGQLAHPRDAMQRDCGLSFCSFRPADHASHERSQTPGGTHSGSSALATVHAIMGCAPGTEIELPEDPSQLPAERRLPGALQKCSEVIFRVALTHMGWTRLLRRGLYRNAVRGNYGLIKRMDVYLPSRVAFPCLLDTPGWHVQDLFRHAMAVQAMSDPRVAMLCLVGSGRDAPGALFNGRCLRQVLSPC